jgi:hypothetical protein
VYVFADSLAGPANLDLEVGIVDRRRAAPGTNNLLVLVSQRIGERLFKIDVDRFFLWILEDLLLRHRHT